jgi:hypothetical protein
MGLAMCMLDSLLWLNTSTAARAEERMGTWVPESSRGSFTVIESCFSVFGGIMEERKRGEEKDKVEVKLVIVSSMFVTAFSGRDSRLWEVYSFVSCPPKGKCGAEGSEWVCSPNSWGTDGTFELSSRSKEAEEMRERRESCAWCWIWPELSHIASVFMTFTLRL